MLRFTKINFTFLSFPPYLALLCATFCWWIQKVFVCAMFWRFLLMILSRYSVIVFVSLVCMVFVGYFCFSLLSICGHEPLNPKLCCIFVLLHTMMFSFFHEKTMLRLMTWILVHHSEEYMHIRLHSCGAFCYNIYTYIILPKNNDVAQKFWTYDGLYFPCLRW